jgi:hypothetical protein
MGLTIDKVAALVVSVKVGRGSLDARRVVVKVRCSLGVERVCQQTERGARDICGGS